MIDGVEYVGYSEECLNGENLLKIEALAKPPATRRLTACLRAYTHRQACVAGRFVR